MSWREFDRVVEEYDKWYEKHSNVYQVELSCLKSFKWRSPALEVGVGTGRFSSALGIDVGLDAALKPLMIAKARGTEAVQGFAEELPFRKSAFNSVFFITSLCFLNPERALSEAYKVLKSEGKLIICIIPRDSPLGREYSSRGKKSIFRYASFLTTSEVLDMGESLGMNVEAICNTLFLSGKPCFSCVEMKKVIGSSES